jgi:uncharacterized iron-regulated membrane protein
VRVRRVLLLSHRWIGLASSLVLAIVGLTGAVIFLPRSVPFRRFAGPLHQQLAAGTVGSWVVVSATAAAVLLQLGGAILWWKRKRVSVRTGRGWWSALDDLHHVVGIVGLPLMFVLATTGVAMHFIGPDQPGLRTFLMTSHTAADLPGVVKWVYAAASLGFLVQGVTGVIMYYKDWQRDRAVRLSRSASVGPPDQRR